MSGLLDSMMIICNIRMVLVMDRPESLPFYSTTIHRYNIFDEAIAEVLYVMEVNFKTDFERTKEYRNLNVAVEREAKELQVLRQVRASMSVTFAA